MPDTEMTSEVHVVRGFLEALERLDIDDAVARLHETVVYQNVPLPAARGRAAVTKQLQRLARHGTGFEARIHNIASDGTVVLTERTDVIEIGRVRAEFWVCGTFEIRDGQVVLWRDYFDFVNLAWAFLRGGSRALAGLATSR